MRRWALSGSDLVESESLRGTVAEELWPTKREQAAAEQGAGAAAPSGGRTPPGLPGPRPSHRNHPEPGAALGPAPRR